MARVNVAGHATTSGKRPAGTVLLEQPITSFSIPTVNAECVMDETVQSITFRPPEEVDIIDIESGEAVPTCRVPVLEHKKLIGYIPLPKRYLAVWLELSYQIVVYTNIWRLWAEEEEKARRQAQKEKAGILRRNTGTQVAQHMLARLLTILELVSFTHDADASGQLIVDTLNEWKIRSSRDWFDIPYEQVPTKDHKYLNADPIRLENRVLFEEDWNIDDDGKALLSPPEDLAEWFDGEVDGLEEMFHETLKPQALAALKSQDYYFQTQYDPKAKLLARWHEGHEPRPCFWSVKLWNWMAPGNSLWIKPIDFLYYVLKEDPQYTTPEQFMQDVDALFNIVTGKPDLQLIHGLVMQLWLGEMTWREFVEHLMRNHLHLKQAVSVTTEQKDPNNVFDTFEARLVLEGYVRRHDFTPGEPWDDKDNVLWSALKRVLDKKYKSGWSWIISEVILGKKVTEVLKAAGPWWKKRSKKITKKAQALVDAVENADDGAGAAGPSGLDVEMDEGNDVHMAEPHGHVEPISEGAGQSAGDAGIQEDDAMQGSASSDQQAERNDQEHQTPDAPTNARSPETDAPGSEHDKLTPEQRTAVAQLADYTTDWSLDNYATEMESAFTPEHGSSIKTYVEGLRALGPLTGQDGALAALHSLFRDFLHRIVAIEARKEAGRRQEYLL